MRRRHFLGTVVIGAGFGAGCTGSDSGQNQSDTAITERSPANESTTSGDPTQAAPQRTTRTTPQSTRTPASQTSQIESSSNSTTLQPTLSYHAGIEIVSRVNSPLQVRVVASKLLYSDTVENTPRVGSEVYNQVQTLQNADSVTIDDEFVPRTDYQIKIQVAGKTLYNKPLYNYVHLVLAIESKTEITQISITEF